MEPSDFIAVYEGFQGKVEPVAQKRSRPPNLVFENGKLKQIFLSGSIIKKMMFKGDKRYYCPRYIYRVQLMHQYEDSPSIYMLRGLYFESHILGSSAYDGPILELPRVKGGRKGIDQIRIDAQIHAFPKLAEKYGVEIVKEGPGKNTQVRNKVRWDGGESFEDVEVFITMTYDLVSPFIYAGADYPAAIIDFKLTGDLKGKFGEFAWLNPNDVDHISMLIYSFSSGLPTFYWVFDYTKQLRNDIFPVNTNIHHPDIKKANEAKIRLKEMDQSIRSCITDILTYNEIGWHTEPSLENCKKCPIHDCEDRDKKNEI
jgi:hypothetical protein